MQEEAVAVPAAIPELTLEQRNRVLIMQRQILTMQVNLNQMQKQLEGAIPQLNALVMQIVGEVGADPNRYSFDLDQLRLMPIN